MRSCCPELPRRVPESSNAQENLTPTMMFLQWKLEWHQCDRAGSSGVHSDPESSPTMVGEEVLLLRWKPDWRPLPMFSEGKVVVVCGLSSELTVSRPLVPKRVAVDLPPRRKYKRGKRDGPIEIITLSSFEDDDHKMDEDKPLASMADFMVPAEVPVVVATHDEVPYMGPEVAAIVLQDVPEDDQGPPLGGVPILVDAKDHGIPAME
ncbi:hypothetical protein Dimus_039418 [Dionaea muscipula]